MGFANSRLLAAALAVAFVLGGTIAGRAADPVQQTSPDGASAASAVRLALEAELIGDDTGRTRYLSNALAADPAYAAAHWQLGQVFVEGQWHDLDPAVKLTAAGSRYEEYRRQRQALSGDPKQDQLLARWCEQEELPDRAKLHYARILLNKAANESQSREAQKKLGLELFQGRFLTKDEIAAEERRLASVAEAFKTWQAKLADWQQRIDGGPLPRAKYALEQMQSLDDPAATPVLEAILQAAGEPSSLAIVAVLSRYPEQRATEALARAAVLSRHERVRDAAIAELKRRKLHDYLPLLLAALNPNTRSQFAIQHAPNGAVRYVHQVYQEGIGGNVLATKERVGQPVHIKVERPTTPGNVRDRSYGPLVSTNEDLQLLQDAQIAAAQVEQQVAVQNAVAQKFNQLVFYALEQTTQQKLAHDPVPWWTWWKEYNEVDSSRPTYYAVDRYASQFVSTYQTVPRHSCFVPGTLVWTEAGPRAIESVQVGDRVLSQEPDSGELTFKLVLRTTVSPPAALLTVRAGDDSISASLGHPFWVNRLGWRMIKELKAGDHLHQPTGTLEVTEVSQRQDKLPVHNLVVADFHTYFVGQQKILVHDNTYRQPTLAAVPGLVVNLAVKQ